MPPEPLITKYRPQVFEDVVGQNFVLDALQRRMGDDSHPHAYLLYGPKGVGKTTVARIIGREFGADIMEIDAASHSKVEEARELVDLSQHMSFSSNGLRMLLIDECHRLSRNAFDALLKLIEEPPPHLYIALCTTDYNRVPDTIKSRCYPLHLVPLKDHDMDAFLDAIAFNEGWDVHPDIMLAIKQSSEGSPRLALTLLQSAHDAKSTEEVERLIPLQTANEPVIQLMQMLLQGRGNWNDMRKLLAKIQEQDDYDQILIRAGGYISGAMLRAGSDKSAARAWRILEALTSPVSTFDRRAAFLHAIGKIQWME